MESRETAALRRRQIDRLLNRNPELRVITPPPRGWIVEIRHIIGMRAAQLAARVGVSQSAIAQYERAEAEGAITLQTLEKVARGLNCRFVYAFVPEETFEDMVQARAELVAERLAGEITHAMILEAQEPDAAERQETVKRFSEYLVSKMPRELWDETR